MKAHERHGQIDEAGEDGQIGGVGHEVPERTSGRSYLVAHHAQREVEPDHPVPPCRQIARKATLAAAHVERQPPGGGSRERNASRWKRA